VRAALAALAVIAALGLGIYLGGHPQDLPTPLRDAFVDEHLSLTADARNTIQDRYYQPVGAGQLDNGSIGGMVDSLRRRFKADRYSHYLDPKSLSAFQQETTGHYAGIGLTVGEVKKGLKVGRVFHHSPAEKAGIHTGDVIVAVNGHSIAGESADVSTAKIKGPPGTPVSLKVLAPSTGKARVVKVDREPITVPVVVHRIIHTRAGKIGYVRLASFTEGAHAELRHGVQKVEREGARGILLDLRGNGGGLLQEAVLTASVFIPKGEKVVETRSRSEGNRTYRTVGDNLPRRPLLVLIDRGTASAAEILASALADDIGATTAGTRSFGKGVFQQVMQLPNGGALDLTIGRYFTPNGTSLFPNGIHPDFKVTDRPATRVDEGLRGAAAVLAGKLQHGPNQR
jgi:carboxyl-terminal processing protease